MKCENCQHWERYEESDLEFEDENLDEWREWGECQNLRTHYESRPIAKPPKLSSTNLKAQSWDMEGVESGLTCRSDFFCAHYSAN
jgi:hypothetical protein